MPMSPNFSLLIDRLVDATNKRTLTWSEGPSGTIYSASLSKSSIRIQTNGPGGLRLQAFPMVMSVVDSRGTIIDQIHFEPNEQEFPKVLSFYEMVQRSSRNTDEQIAGILKELDEMVKKTPMKMPAKPTIESRAIIDVAGRIETTKGPEGQTGSSATGPG